MTPANGQRGRHLVPTFFATAQAFGSWLSLHGATAPELIVGFHKRGSGIPSMSWPESVDEALCHGWIDGVRARIDDHSYRIRFTPRKATSIWSTTNIAKVTALKREHRMQPAGLAAFALRKEERSGTYAYEQRETAQLLPEHEARFRKCQAAWTFFEAQPPSYRHKVTWRILSAKRLETQNDRLTKLIDASERGERL